MHCCSWSWAESFANKLDVVHPLLFGLWSVHLVGDHRLGGRICFLFGVVFLALSLAPVAARGGLHVVLALRVSLPSSSRGLSIGVFIDFSKVWYSGRFRDIFELRGAGQVEGFAACIF